MSEVKSVSVVIPCFNAAPFLKECLDSVLNQTRPADEIILVNDGSTDASLEIAESFGAKIKIISQTNQGVSSARNRGILEAKSEWIAIQDADDVWHPEKLELQSLAILTSKNKPVCCYTDFYLFGEGIKWEHCSRPELHLEKEAFSQMLADWSVTSNAALFRADLARQNPFPENIRDCEDTIFFACLRKTGPFLRLPQPLAGYRKGPHQRTALPDQEWLALKALVSWADQNRESKFTDLEFELFSHLILKRMMNVYKKAFWSRDWKTVKECRKLFFKSLRSQTEITPKEFRKILFPKWIFLLKDWIHQKLHPSH